MSVGTGQVFIVSAPSGGGKTSLVQYLVSSLDNIQISISHTTRDRRVGEVENEHYFFISENQFLSMVNKGAFVEYASVYGHHYGTSTEQLHERLSKGIDVVLDIDWQGAKQIKQRFPEAKSIFILPPSFEVLRQRLTDRRRDTEEIIHGRMDKAYAEIKHYDEFDYLIINDDFARAGDALRSIVVAARSKMNIQAQRHQRLLTTLMTGA